MRWRDGADVDAGIGAHRRVARAVPIGPWARRFHWKSIASTSCGVLPWLLGAFLVLIGVLGVGYGLVTSVRRRVT